MGREPEASELVFSRHFRKTVATEAKERGRKWKYQETVEGPPWGTKMSQFLQNPGTNLVGSEGLGSISHGFLKVPHGFPWWSSGKESTSQCRKYGFNPWSGKIAHAVEQLGPCATTTEPVHALEPGTDYWSLCVLGSGFPKRRSHHNEKLTHRN